MRKLSVGPTLPIGQMCVYGISSEHARELCSEIVRQVERAGLALGVDAELPRGVTPLFAIPAHGGSLEMNA